MGWFNHQQDYPVDKNQQQKHLKINGWKMNLSFGMDYVQGLC